MSKVAPWYAVVVSARGLIGEGMLSVYHDDNACRVGQAIPRGLRGEGLGTELAHCRACAQLDAYA